MTEWQKNENKTKNQITTESDDNNNLIQPRDEDEDLMEEFMAFHNKVIDTSGYSIDTYFGNKGDDSKSKIMNHLSVNAGRKILVLIPNNRARYNEKRVDLFSDSDIICFVKERKRYRKNLIQIYWSILSIKQQIINYFSFIKCCGIIESFIPLQMRLIRSIFIFILSLILNMSLLNQNYYHQKFTYFNEKYKLLTLQKEEDLYNEDDIDSNKFSSSERINYAFSHLFVKGLIVFFILLVVNFVINIIFFSLRKKVLDLMKKNNLEGIKELAKKTKKKHLIFYIINSILLLFFFFFFIGFGAVYGGGFADYMVGAFYSLLLFELFPFLWSLILTLILYYGIKKKKKCWTSFCRFFIF